MIHFRELCLVRFGLGLLDFADVAQVSKARCIAVSIERGQKKDVDLSLPDDAELNLLYVDHQRIGTSAVISCKRMGEPSWWICYPFPTSARADQRQRMAEAGCFEAMKGVQGKTVASLGRVCNILIPTGKTGKPQPT